MNPLQAELDYTLALVQQCGQIALSYWRQGAKVLRLRQKPLGGGPVTVADAEINERIVSALAKRFPDDGILAEESVDNGAWQAARRCWYVDPIDGTREFARGRTGWTIQVGMCIDAQPVLGVVLEPAAGHLSWGICWEGVHVTQWIQPDGHQQRLEPAQRSLDDLILIGGRIYPLSRQHAIRKALGVSDQRTRSVGSVGVRMATVARGGADVYVQAPGHTKMWDTCAPAALLMACGARVTDLSGAPLRYRASSVTHPHGVVVSHAEHHPAILHKLAPLVARWR